MDFQWLPLTWDALATLLTGLAAVGGATFVGHRQVSISERQLLIQQSQAEHDRQIRSNQLKLELLDRRSSCLLQVRSVNQALLQNGEIRSDDWKTLYEAIQESELIFPVGQVDGLREVSSASIRARFSRRAQNDAFKRGDEDQAEKWHARASTNEDLIFEKLPSLVESMVKHSRLHDV